MLYPRRRRYYVLFFFFFFFFLLWIMGLCHGSGSNYYNSKDAAACTSVLYVGKSGDQANFSTIQSAIDYVPTGNRNNKWVCIQIQAATYREKVTIGGDKPYIMLSGAGKDNTFVIWGDHGSIAQDSTFSTFATNIVVNSITFVNSYNSPGSKTPRTPTVAALVGNDSTSFYGCGFRSLQDTLWDSEGRHYFYQCTIQGAVDFIFGAGQSIYEGCQIDVLGDELETGFVGFITAHSRQSANETSGFVFKNCTVSGTGSIYLGRPWRPYARVLFYASTLSNIIRPEGWATGDYPGHQATITFAEHGNSGPGSDSSHRISWEKQLSDEELNYLTSMRFIGAQTWLSNQPTLDPDSYVSGVPSSSPSLDLWVDDEYSLS